MSRPIFERPGPAAAAPDPDVIDWRYKRNSLRPTQTPVSILKLLIEAFTETGDVMSDPFCSTGSALVAARELGRRFAGIELDARHRATAMRRLLAAAGEGRAA